MSGFTITVERVSDEDSEDPPQLWQSPIELSRDFQPGDGEIYEVWTATTTASAYRDCIGPSPENALRAFSREVAEVFGDTGTGPGILWVASADAPAYSDCPGPTMASALRILSKEFHRVYGDRNEGEQ